MPFREWEILVGTDKLGARSYVGPLHEDWPLFLLAEAAAVSAPLRWTGRQAVSDSGCFNARAFSIRTNGSSWSPILPTAGPRRW